MRGREFAACTETCGDGCGWGTAAGRGRGVRPVAGGGLRAARGRALPSGRARRRARPGQHRVAAARLGVQGGECAAYRLAQAAADTDTVPVRLRIVVRTGHFLTTRGVARQLAAVPSSGPAWPPLLLGPILTASLGAGRVSGKRMTDVISWRGSAPARGLRRPPSSAIAAGLGTGRELRPPHSCLLCRLRRPMNSITAAM